MKSFRLFVLLSDIQQVSDICVLMEKRDIFFLKRITEIADITKSYVSILNESKSVK